MKNKKSSHSPKQLMQPDESMAQFQERLSALEQENTRLRTELQDGERSLFFQARVVELERANALLQAEVRERRRCEQVWQGQTQALTRTLEALITAPDLDQFLGQVLEAIVQQMGEAAGGLWLYDQALDCLRLHLTYENGQVESAIATSHPGVQAERTHQSTEQLQRLREHKAIVLDRQYLTTDPKAAAYRAFVEERGIQSILNVPLFLGEEFLGTYTIRSTTRETYSAEEIDLAQALAQQAVLAIQTTRLAEEAKQAAIALEQEKAALEQAAELAKANDAIARTSERLAEQPDLCAFLNHIALEVIAALGADAAMLSALDEQCQVLRAVAHVEQGQIPVSTLVAQIPVDEADFVKVLLQSRKPRYFNLEQEAHLFWPGAIDYHQQRSHRAIMGVPLFVGGNFLGHLGLAFTHTDPIQEQGSELLYALAQQAALAIQLTKLAEESKQAAIAKEQEKAATERATQLAKANEVLRQTVDVLANESELNNFLGHVLKVIAQQLDAPLTEYWYHPEPGDVAYLGLSCFQGEILTPAEQPGHPGVSGFPVPTEMLPGESLHHRQRHFVVEDVTTHAPHLKVNAQIGVDTERWCAERGVRKLLNVPLRLGEKTIGGLLIWIPGERHFSEEQIELAYALAQQVTLAIQLTRLAEEAKLAAIAKEQEKVATERATQLAQANSALQRSLEQMSLEQGLDSLLNQVLLEAINLSGACSGGLFIRLNRWETKFRPAAIIEGKSLKELKDTLYAKTFPDFIERSGDDETGFFATLTRGKSRFLRIENPDPLWWQESIVYHQSLGHKVVWHLPMCLRDEVIGMFGLCFEREVEIKQETVEHITTLANQATLAVRLTQLAEEAKLVAIAREQEKAVTERAAELAKANEALRHSIDALTQQPSIEAFLSVTLQAIAEVLEVPSACLWKYQGEFSYLQLVYQEQQVIPAEQTDHPNARKPLRQCPLTYDSAGKLHTQPFYYPIDDPATPLDDELRRMLQRLGVRCLINAPIVIGERAVAAITARLTHKMPDPSPTRLELVNTLANQAALALQMVELADQAKESAILEERNRMACEIHDALAQGFTGITTHLEAAKRALRQNPTKAQSCIESALALARASLSEARHSVWNLRPPVLESGDLKTAFQDLVKTIAASSDVDVEVRSQGQIERLKPQAEYELFRIGQEALCNALKHSRAPNVTLELIQEPQQLTLHVHDNGCGFDLNRPISGRGFGLISMRERAERLGGQLTIRSAVGEGTQVSATVPVRADKTYGEDR